MKNWKKKCPKCFSRLKNQGIRTRKIHTGSTGEAIVARYYYTCTNKRCDYSCIPLDQMLGIGSNYAAGTFESKICFLAAEMPFANVCRYLETQDEIKISQTMVRNTAETYGSAIIAKESQEYLLNVKQETDTLYGQIDGSMVRIETGSEEGLQVEFKECKLGIFYRQQDILEKEYTQKNRKKTDSNILNKKFVSSIGKGVGDFEAKWLSKIKSYSFKQLVMLSDGAVWIDNLISRNFPNAIHILDWYHAVEHLWTCAKDIFGDDNISKLTSFVEPLKKIMWDGDIELLCNTILKQMKRYPQKQTQLRELYSYYSTRKEKMRYKEFRKAGFAIGSGSIESANKYLVQKRLKGAGMKWSIPVAEAILKIREKIYEKSYDFRQKTERLNF